MEFWVVPTHAVKMLDNIIIYLENVHIIEKISENLKIFIAAFFFLILFRYYKLFLFFFFFVLWWILCTFQYHV